MFVSHTRVSFIRANIKIWIVNDDCIDDVAAPGTSSFHGYECFQRELLQNKISS